MHRVCGKKMSLCTDIAPLVIAIIDLHYEMCVYVCVASSNVFSGR